MSAELIPTLETERLVLRAPEERDLAPLTAFFKTPASHFVGGPMSANDTERAMLATLGSWALYGFGLWHIGEKPTGRFIGWTGLLNAADRIEPGFAWSILPDAQGKGYATEAAIAALGYSAQHLGRAAPATYIDAKNEASLKVAQKLGFALESDAGNELTYRYQGEAA